MRITDLLEIFTGFLLFDCESGRVTEETASDEESGTSEEEEEEEEDQEESEPEEQDAAEHDAETEADKTEDDLTVVRLALFVFRHCLIFRFQLEGVGPKIAQLLIKGGCSTFDSVANVTTHFFFGCNGFQLCPSG